MFDLRGNHRMQLTLPLLENFPGCLPLKVFSGATSEYVEGYRRGWNTAEENAADSYEQMMKEATERTYRVDTLENVKIQISGWQLFEKETFDFIKGLRDGWEGFRGQKQEQEQAAVSRSV